MSDGIISMLLYMSGNLFRIYLLCQFLRIFFNPACSGLRLAARYISFIGFFIVNSTGFLGLEWPSEIVLLSNYIGAFAVTITYKGKWRYRLLSPIIVVTLNLICEGVIYRLMMYIGAVNIVVTTIAVTNLVLLVIISLFRKFSDFQHGEEISAVEWASIIIVPLVSGTISIIALDDCVSQMAANIGGIGLLLLNVTVFYLMERLTNLYKAQREMLVLEGQSKAYIKQLDIVRTSEEKAAAIRHDIRNHMTVLQYMAEKNGNDEILAYLDKIHVLVRNEERFINTGDYLIDGLLNLKLSEAAKLPDTEIIHEIHFESVDELDKMDFSILLGNLLDNAIEALSTCSKDRKLKVIIEEARGVVLIEIENTYEGELIYKNGKFVTTKMDKENHGIGIKNIMHIVNKYNGQADFYYENNTFSAELIIYLN